MPKRSLGMQKPFLGCFVKELLGAEVDYKDLPVFPGNRTWGAHPSVSRLKGCFSGCWEITDPGVTVRGKKKEKERKKKKRSGRKKWC